MKIYGIIPARKESKRLTHKNIRTINNKTLIEYAIEEAKKSKYINDIFISSDDPVVLKIGKKYGLKERDRPKELATDTATSQEVVDDLDLWIPHDHKPDFYVLLQPTSPLRKAKHIDKCIETYIKGSFESVISVKEIAPYVYYPNGAVYVFKDKIYTKNMGFILMDRESSIDIDTYEDFRLARYYMESKNDRDDR